MGNSIAKVQLGQRFGRLAVLREGPRHIMPSLPRGARTFWCQCDCGRIKRVRQDHLVSGASQSCGCLIGDTGRARGVPVEVGQRFGRGVVIDSHVRIFYPSSPSCPGARLACDCGETYEAAAGSLRGGLVKSCGCLHREARPGAVAACTTHGLSDNPLYCIWTNMMRRCTDQRDKAYPSYGGRAIQVSPEWHDVAAFIAWVETNLGQRPEGAYPSGVPRFTIDRINNDGNYEPGNLRWATKSEQQMNRRNSRRRPAA